MDSPIINKLHTLPKKERYELIKVKIRKDLNEYNCSNSGVKYSIRKNIKAIIQDLSPDLFDKLVYNKEIIKGKITYKCFECEERYTRTAMKYIYKRWLCAECSNELYVKCECENKQCLSGISTNCEKYVYKLEKRVNGNCAICSFCKSDHYIYCSNCNKKQVPVNNMKLLCDDCSSFVCQDCMSTHNCSVRNGLNSYVPHRSYNKHSKILPIRNSLYNIITINRNVGVEIEAVDGIIKSMGNLNNNTGIINDTSMQGADNGSGNNLEFQTPPATLEVMEYYIKNACDVFKYNDFKINKTCGVHIHINCSDFFTNGDKLVQLMNTYYAIEPIIYRMLPKSRSRNNYCLPLNKWISELDLWELNQKYKNNREYLLSKWYKTHNAMQIVDRQNNRYHTSRYHGVNLHPLFSCGHLELRHHHGSLNPIKILYWTEFNLHLVEWAVNNYSKPILEKIYNENDFKRKIGMFIKEFGLKPTLIHYLKKRLKKREDKLNLHL